MGEKLDSGVEAGVLPAESSDGRRVTNMRLISRLVGVALAAAMAFNAGCGCGGNSTANQQDAAPDAPPQFDGPHDVAPFQDDAGPECGTFAQPNGCGFELTRCNTAKTNSDECGDDLDCVDTGLYGLVCLRKCTCSAECGINTICLPSNTGDYDTYTEASAFFKNAKGHCFYSFCGGGGSYEAAVGNGSLFGPCTLGGESYFKPGKVQTRPGTCSPLWTHEPNGTTLGICEEAGAVKRGGTCSFDVNQCEAPSTFDACAVGSVCIGRRGQLTGTCAKLCDPSATGFNPAVTGVCASDSDLAHDQYCQDSSDYQRDCTESDAGVSYGTDIFLRAIGFCVDTPGCDVFAAANNCASAVSDGGVAWNGCEPTTPVDPYGLCGPTGSVGLGGTCNNSLLCQAGFVCITTSGSSNGTCEKYCGFGPNAGKWPCAGGEYCDPILYGSDPSSECWDDPWTLGFGICRPDTRQDGGTDA
jgi:hypothetical protein